MCRHCVSPGDYAHIPLLLNSQSFRDLPPRKSFFRFGAKGLIALRHRFGLSEADSRTHPPPYQDRAGVCFLGET